MHGRLAALAAILVVATALAGCTEQTDPATNITPTSATLNGTVTVGSKDKGGAFWFEWSRDNGATWNQGPHHLWGSQNCTYSGSGTEGNPAPVQENVTGLVADSHYIFRIAGTICNIPVVYGDSNWTSGSDSDPPYEYDSFDTPPAPPVVSTGPGEEPPDKIAFHGASWNGQNIGNISPPTLAVPRGTKPNDVMIASISTKGTTITAPPGWTAILDTVGPTEYCRSSSCDLGVDQVSFYHIASEAEPASYTWTVANGAPAVGGIASYGGVDTLNPIAASQASAGNSGGAVAPSVTLDLAGARVISAVSFGAPQNNVTPADANTERWDTTQIVRWPYVTNELADRNVIHSGATATTTTANPDNPDEWVAQTIALKPWGSLPTFAWGAVGSLPLDAPGGTVPGDIMIATIVAPGGGAITAPTGWTTIRDTTNGTNLRQVTYYRFAGGDEPLSYTWSVGSGRDAAGGIVSYKGVDPQNPIEASADASGANGNAVAPSVNLNPGGGLVITANSYGRGPPTTVGPDTSTFERWQIGQGSSNGGVTGQSADRNLSSSGPTGSTTAAPSDAGGPWVAQAIALQTDSSPPDLNLTGMLYTKRLSTATPGTYQLVTDAVDGNKDVTPAAGVKSLEITLDGQRVDFAQQSCPNGSCSLHREWTFRTSDRPMGQHTIAVTTVDQLNHSTTQSFGLTEAPLPPGSPAGDIYHVQEYTGDPANGGRMLNEDWARLDGRLVRDENSDGTVATRDTASCIATSGQCDEMRQAVNEGRTTGQDQWGYSVEQSVQADDPNLYQPAEELSPARLQGLTPKATGPISTAVPAWEVLPPGHGSNYELYESTLMADGSDPSVPAGTPVYDRLWIDTATKLPLVEKVGMIRNGTDQALGNEYWQYDPQLYAQDSLPAGFFSVQPPGTVDDALTVQMFGAGNIPSAIDQETGATIQAYDLGPSADIAGVGQFCLVDTDIVEMSSDPAGVYGAAAPPDLDPQIAGFDPAAPKTSVSADYKETADGQCNPGTGSLPTPDLSIVSMDANSSDGVAWNAVYEDSANQPNPTRDAPAVISSGLNRTSALVETSGTTTNGTTTIVQGNYTPSQATAITQELQPRG